MTQLGEAQTTVAGMLDELGTAMGNHADYTQPTTSVDNSGTNTDWQNNSVVYEHVPTGVYLLFTISAPSADKMRIEYNSYGIRLVISSGWDSNNDAPSGNTNLDSNNDSPILNDAPNADDRSTTYLNNSNNSPMGWGFYNGGYGDNKDNFRGVDLTYVGSVNNEGVHLGMWNTTSSSYGEASVLSWYHIQNKFWADGQEFFTALVENTANSDISAVYGWRWVHKGNNIDETPNGITGAEWGFINSDSNDDTFFFRWPVTHTTQSEKEPVCFFKSWMSNDRSAGAAHGDVITHDGNDYIIVKQQGNSQTNYTTSAAVLNK